MSYTRPLVVIAFIAMLAMILGCSGGSPVGLDKEAGTLDSIPVIGLSEVGDMFNAVGLLGAYEININPETMSAELVAKRTSSAIGDSFVISGLPFFTMTPCQNCVELTGVKLTAGGDAALSFAVRHPFKMGSMSLPPTAANRRDLDIFDVAAVITPIGGTATAYTALGSIYDTICVGPAGYTKELANLFTPADTAAMPFFLVKDDSIDAVPPVSTYNKFAMGGSDNFDVVFNLGGGVLKFDMYLTFGYGAAAKGSDKATFLAPKYFNPEFNRKNAWKVAVTPPTVPWFDNMPAEEKNIEVKVWDWQQGATVSTTTPYSDETVKTKVYEASNVTKVEIELFGDTGEALVATSGLGTPISPLVYDVTIANSLSKPAGDYIGLVKVSDSRTVAAAFTEGQDFLIDTPDGIALNNVLMTEFATYQTFEAEIIVGCGPIVLGTVTGCPVAPVPNLSGITFTVTASSFMSTQISYEIDSDYDGTTFVPDGPSNTTGIFNATFNSSPCLVGDTFDVAVRMTDDCVPPNVEVFEICTVEIGTCCGPIDGSGAFITTTCPQTINAGNSISFVVGGVLCPGGTVTYQVDYSYDGITFNSENTTTTGTFPPYNFATPGVYIVAFRAVDDCTPQGVYDFTSTCTITVVAPPCPTWNDVLTYDWAGCTAFGTRQCQGWTTAQSTVWPNGCGLPNTASWGAWFWGCSPAETCAYLTYPILHCNYDHPTEGYSSCAWGGDILSGDRWAVSSLIFLPTINNPAENATVSYGYCIGTTNYLYMMILPVPTGTGCPSSISSWLTIDSSTPTGCQNITGINLAPYAGQNIRLAVRWNGTGNTGSGCGAIAGNVDNIILNGNFCVAEAQHMAVTGP